jgi:peptidoglycan LD-endopeptidase LytH
VSRRVHAVAIALLLLIGSACRVDRRGSDLPDSAHASAADTLTAIAPREVEDVDSTLAASSPADTTPLVATTEELDELAARLTIPVDGVAVTDLIDTYAELRGGGSRSHDALDLPAPTGTPVRSAADGRLLRLYTSEAGGLMVYAADASDRFILTYGHLDRYAEGLVEGQALAQGQVIGYVGTTGNAPSGTPHLHFAIARGRPSVAWWRGTPVNPYPLLTAMADTSTASSKDAIPLVPLRE